MDSGTLPATWQEAFDNHPIARIRAFEKQLQASTSRDKEKLRALVGNSYRDLLHTAEQIVELDDQNRSAEESISALSRACKPPSRFNEISTPSKSAVTASHVRLTDNLLRCTSKATREGSVLLASRTIVIARLLLKHIEQDSGTSKTSKWLTSRLKAVRQQLLHRIDIIFVQPKASLPQLIQAAGAYCLTTSASSSEAVRHFRTVRAQRLAQSSVEEMKGSEARNDLKQRCHYFNVSVTAIKALSGRGLVELLNTLQKQPILDDPELVRIETLQIDSINKLLPADILSFAPYFKRTTSTPAELRSSLQQWVDEAMQNLLKHIKTAVSSSSLRGVIKTRQVVLEILLSNCFSTQSQDTITTSIKDAFSKRIIELVEQKAQSLNLLGNRLASVVESSRSSEGTIWSSSIPRDMTSQPAPLFVRAVRHSHLGVTENIAKYLESLSTWLLECRRTKEKLEELTKVRWQDKIEEFDDDDEDIARDFASSLSKQDPMQYIASFERALQKSAADFITTILDVTSQNSLSTSKPTPSSSNPAAESINEDSSQSAPHSRITALLRIIREASTALAQLSPSTSLTPLRETTTALHTQLAQHTAKAVFQQLDQDKTQSPNSQSNPKAAFTPDNLPSQPTVSLLSTLCRTMTITGGIDIWTPHATEALKQVMLESLFNEHDDGGNGDPETGFQIRQKYVHSDFDEAYLRVALGTRQRQDGDGTGKTDTEGQTKVSADVQRRATGYWNRTRLLFGVLNS